MERICPCSTRHYMTVDGDYFIHHYIKIRVDVSDLIKQSSWYMKPIPVLSRPLLQGRFNESCSLKINGRLIKFFLKTQNIKWIFSMTKKSWKINQIFSMKNSWKIRHIFSLKKSWKINQISLENDGKFKQIFSPETIRNNIYLAGSCIDNCRHRKKQCASHAILLECLHIQVSTIEYIQQWMKQRNIQWNKCSRIEEILQYFSCLCLYSLCEH